MCAHWETENILFIWVVVFNIKILLPERLPQVEQYYFVLHTSSVGVSHFSCIFLALCCGAKMWDLLLGLVFRLFHRLSWSFYSNFSYSLFGGKDSSRIKTFVIYKLNFQNNYYGMKCLHSWSYQEIYCCNDVFLELTVQVCYLWVQPSTGETDIDDRDCRWFVTVYKLMVRVLVQFLRRAGRNKHHSVFSSEI
jgi:hypothetical protein